MLQCYKKQRVSHMQPLQSYLLQGATSYLEFLEQTNQGIEEIHILRIRMEKYDTLLLELDRMLFGTDYLQVYIQDFIIDIDSFEEKSFNEPTKTLRLKFSDSLLTTLLDETTQNNKEVKLSKDSIISYLLGDNYKKEVPKHLRIFNDLKFLVKNIRDFLNKDSLKLALPTTKPIELKITLDSHISKEQQEAIKGIFTHPISYVWGISGSGKTQVVLFNCLLNLITQNKKTLILAPTNTALEQIFIALITQGDRKGLPRYKFLRLGMPSSDFLQNFPDVCLQADEKDSKEELESNNELQSLFKPQTLKERLQECLVIGVTLDSFVKRYAQLCELEFSHIFLDECAFSPLIKLIAPLTLNTPITLLGDHKQLMPICHMQDSDIQTKHFEVCVWSLNTLFLEILFNNHAILHAQHNYDDITFNSIAHYKLTTTHRYGNNLAHVLDRHVYHNGLNGKGLPTEIYYIDSTSFGPNYEYNAQNNRNESMGEANAITALTQILIDEYAILTPFRDQQKLLISKRIPKHSVFTIHKSQGKEFDTIIFSPVKFSKYMTDSYNKAALFALNVAVSRLKKKLIIVCDYSSWIRRQGQFITALLQNAKPYPLSHRQPIKPSELPF